MNHDGRQRGNEDRRASKEETPGHACAHLKAQHEFTPGAAKGDKSVFRGYNNSTFGKLYMPVEFILDYEQDPERYVIPVICLHYRA